MKFTKTEIVGVVLVTLERNSDERGYFARSFCKKEFAAHGLNPCIAQCNVSFNKKKGTLRGMHYQVAPHAEAKLVRCTRGAVYDVVVDLRPASATFKQWLAFELTADNGNMLYIAEGLAHGFQTLADDSELFYQMADIYVPELARGVRWDDPAFRIKWPEDKERMISAKDLAYKDFVS